MKLFLLSYFTLGATVNVEWDIQWIQNIKSPFDESLKRNMIGVNGKWPIDPIVATIGDTLSLKVINNLDTPTSIHFHGLFQNGTNYYDGAFGITQCGIPVGSTFTYTFPIQQQGTYWAHGHSNGQYVDGLRAPLILKGKNDTIPEFVISLSDWYNQYHSTLLQKYLSIYNPFGMEPVPDGPLVNEKTSDIFSIQPSTTYRLRFISMTSISAFFVWIDNHEMKVVEIDGVEIEPYPISSFTIAPAQRFSVLVTTKNNSALNYNIHALMDVTMFDGPPPPVDNVNVTLSFGDNVPLFQATSTPLEREDGEDGEIQTDYDDMKAVPVIVEGAVQADQSFTLDVNFLLFSDGVNHGAFNDIFFKPPLVPSLFSAMTMGSLATDAAVYGPSTQSLVLDHLKMVQIVVNNLDAKSHPFHLHGHHFQIIDKGKGVYSPPTEKYTLKNPPKRDTVIVPGEGYTVIQFRADNPGAWLFHCHIEWHLQAGLALQVIEAPLEMQSRLLIPPALSTQCHQLQIKTSGNAGGINSSSDFGGTSVLDVVKVWPTYMTWKGYIGFFSATFCGIVGLFVLVWYSKPDEQVVVDGGNSTTSPSNDHAFTSSSPAVADAVAGPSTAS